MSQSLSKIYTHLVFSTKHREDLIPPSRKSELFGYMAEILKAQGCPVLRIGGTLNHVHILYVQAKTKALCDTVRVLKACSSKWMNIQKGRYDLFAWQDGYGAFSISQKHVDVLTRYIENQENHHHQTSYQNEYRRICKLYDAGLDERYAWD